MIFEGLNHLNLGDCLRVTCMATFETLFGKVAYLATIGKQRFIKE
jgi:hypothetical protein